MAVASLIVEVEEGFGGAVMRSLADIDNLSVYGIKENQIIAVIEGNDAVSMENTMKLLYSIENVFGVFPVFAGDYQ